MSFKGGGQATLLEETTGRVLSSSLSELELDDDTKMQNDKVRVFYGHTYALL